ncbi:hypothetical protein M0R45_013650 [Rubus argutus]|uniref:Uncharacterized protein n=1 Tax=Rubus argutus TaxID=59490 RepID=A0AAW1XMG6_RUBAR
MANARLARFITEVAPPQIVSVMRHRTSKVLDTITEEEREYGKPNDSLNSAPKGSASSSPSSPSFAAAAASARTDSKYFLKGVQRDLNTRIEVPKALLSAGVGFLFLSPLKKTLNQLSSSWMIPFLPSPSSVSPVLPQ